MNMATKRQPRSQRPSLKMDRLTAGITLTAVVVSSALCAMGDNVILNTGLVAIAFALCIKINTAFIR